MDADEISKLSRDTVCWVTKLCVTQRPNSSPVGKISSVIAQSVEKDVLSIYCPKLSTAEIILSSFAFSSLR